jgi:VanZ family protein
VGVGVLIELIQDLTPDRSAELGDVVAEAIGAVAALAVHALVRWIVLRRAAASQDAG